MPAPTHFAGLISPQRGEALDEKGNARQLKLFPEDRASETVGGQVVKIRMDKLAVRNMRNWGEVWLGTELWDRLGLDGFWSPRLPPSRKGTYLLRTNLTDGTSSCRGSPVK